jgi:lauroyl/myristoyl acyltransferase
MKITANEMAALTTNSLEKVNKKYQKQLAHLARIIDRHIKRKARKGQFKLKYVFYRKFPKEVGKLLEKHYESLGFYAFYYIDTWDTQKQILGIQWKKEEEEE